FESYRDTIGQGRSTDWQQGKVELLLAADKDVESQREYDFRQIRWTAGSADGSARHVSECATLPVELRSHIIANAFAAPGGGVSKQLLPGSFGNNKGATH